MIRVRFRGDALQEVYEYDESIRDRIRYLDCAVSFESLQEKHESLETHRDVWIERDTQDEYVSQRSFRILDRLIRGDFDVEIPFGVFHELVQTISYLDVEDCDQLLAEVIDGGNVFYTKAKKNLQTLCDEETPEDRYFTLAVHSVCNLPWNMERTKSALADLIVFLSHRRCMIENLPDCMVEYIWNKKRRRFGLEIDVLRVALAWFKANPDNRLFQNFCSDFRRDSLMASPVLSALMSQHAVIAEVYELCLGSEKKKCSYQNVLLRGEFERLLRKLNMYNFVTTLPHFEQDAEFSRARDACGRLAASLVTSKSFPEFAIEMINRKPREPLAYGFSHIVRYGNELYEHNPYLKRFRHLIRFPESCMELNHEDLIVADYEPAGVLLTLARPSPLFKNAVPVWYADFGVLHGHVESPRKGYTWKLLANEVTSRACMFERAIFGNRATRGRTKEGEVFSPLLVLCKANRNGYFVNSLQQKYET